MKSAHTAFLLRTDAGIPSLNGGGWLNQRPPSSKCSPRALYRRSRRLRMSPMLFRIRLLGSRNVVLRNLAKYCVRVSRLHFLHLDSVLRILVFTLCQSQSSQTFKPGLRCGMWKGTIFASRFARLPFPHWKPAGSSSSSTRHLRFLGHALRRAFLIGPYALDATSA